MLNLQTTKRLAASLTLGAALLVQAPAWAQAPAELAPADTPVFIHIDEPADWFDEMTDGPLGKKWRAMIEESEGSGDLLAAMGMDVEKFMDAYFGSEVVVLGQGKGDDGEEGPGVIFTKVDQDHRAHAIESLALKQQGDIAGNPVYTGEDGDGFIVMTEDWVAMCDLKSYEYLQSILKQPANTLRLADTEHYKKWTKELPADRAMTMLAIESNDAQHAMGVVRKGKGMDATYLGTSPDYDKMMAMLGENNAADFGPLPAQTISAISFNMMTNEQPCKGMEKLDVLLNGKSFVDDIYLKIDSTMVMFMGSVPGDQLDPKVSVEVPAFGMAIKMKDAAVAKDMDLMFDNVVMLANVSVMNFEAGLIPQRTAEHEGTTFKVAELGKPIAKGMSFPELAPMQIVYGTVGDYYIVCTQEQFFKQCVDADKADKTMQVKIAGKPHRLAKTPVLAMNAKPDRFASMALSWMKMLDEKGLPDALDDEQHMPLQNEHAQDMMQMLEQYSQVEMQLWTGEDGLIIGRAQLIAPE